MKSESSLLVSEQCRRSLNICYSKCSSGFSKTHRHRVNRPSNSSLPVFSCVTPAGKAPSQQGKEAPRLPLTPAQCSPTDQQTHTPSSGLLTSCKSQHEKDNHNVLQPDTVPITPAPKMSFPKMPKPAAAARFQFCWRANIHARPDSEEEGSLPRARLVGISALSPSHSQ